MTRIGLNLLYLIPDVVGGTETYARGLLRGISTQNKRYQIVLFINRETDAQLPDEFSSFERIVCPVNATHREKRYFFEQVHLPRLLKENGIALLHSLGYTAPLFAGCPSVVTVHDLNFKAFGQSMPWVRRSALAFFVRGSLVRSDRVITVSEFSRREILSSYNIDSHKVVVIHEAALIPESGVGVERNNDFNNVHLPERYFVAFSSPSVNKNIPRLLEAYRRLREHNRISHKLILIGHAPREVNARLTDLIVAGYIPRAHVLAILRGAEFLVFPSFYEGFGLPVLEAMMCGVPVVCSNAASLPEIGGEAALYFNPYSTDDLVNAIEIVANDPVLRESLRQRGYENVKRFSWETTAAKTLTVYDELLDNVREGRRERS
jgi:glycosyltransferase involved in cell wall biosynthesis